MVYTQTTRRTIQFAGGMGIGFLLTVVVPAISITRHPATDETLKAARRAIAFGEWWPYAAAVLLVILTAAVALRTLHSMARRHKRRVKLPTAAFICLAFMAMPIYASAHDQCAVGVKEMRAANQAWTNMIIRSWAIFYDHGLGQIAAETCKAIRNGSKLPNDGVDIQYRRMDPPEEVEKAAGHKINFPEYLTALHMRAMKSREAKAAHR